MRMRKTTMAALAAGVLLLGACSRSEPEQPAESDNAAEAVPAETPLPTAVPSEAPTEAAPAANDTALAPPAEQPVAPDAQMLDDADATGMTARVDRNGEPAGNDQAIQ